MGVRIGIDQSFTSTGVCAIDEATGVVMAFTVITTKKESDDKLDKMRRARQIVNRIGDFLDQFDDISSIALEGIGFGARGDALTSLAGLQFMIVDYIMSFYWDPFIIPPTTLKKFATGSGKAGKADMINAVPPDVLEEFQLSSYKNASTNDLCDAYWLAMYAE